MHGIKCLNSDLVWCYVYSKNYYAKKTWVQLWYIKV
jgi:hypothetical protein